MFSTRTYLVILRLSHSVSNGSLRLGLSFCSFQSLAAADTCLERHAEYQFSRGVRGRNQGGCH